MAYRVRLSYPKTTEFQWLLRVIPLMALKYINKQNFFWMGLFKMNYTVIWKQEDTYSSLCLELSSSLSTLENPYSLPIFQICFTHSPSGENFIYIYFPQGVDLGRPGDAEGPVSKRRCWASWW